MSMSSLLPLIGITMANSLDRQTEELRRQSEILRKEQILADLTEATPTMIDENVAKENSVKERQNSYTPWIQNNEKFDINRIHWYNTPGMNSYDIEQLISSATDFVYVYAVWDDDVTDDIRFSTQPPKDKDIVIEGFKKIPYDVIDIALRSWEDVKSLNLKEKETMYNYMDRGVAKIKKDYLDKRPIEARQEICNIMNLLTHYDIWCEYE